jgi:tetratricopeptide (TPR) repeat protein
LQLRGLHAGAAAVLIERTLGRAPAQRDVDVLYALAGGNPLLLGTLAQHFAASGRELSELAAHPVPERMASAVYKHLAQLPAATREALSLAAALGREFPAQHLAGLLGCSEPELHELLEPALRRAIIRHESGDGSQLTFAHALVCHAIYQELGAARRIELHRRIGELLETSAPPERQPLYELAHHYYRAAADGCRAKAIEYARRAAAHAESVSAHETAAGLYERALNLSEAEAVDAAQWHELACSAGEAHYRAGQLEAARACFARAMERAQREQSSEHYAWALLRCCSALRGSIITDLRRQEQVRLALAQLPPDDSMVRALLTVANMLADRSRGADQRRLEVTEHAVAMARRAGDPLQLQWTLDAQHIVLWGSAPPQLLQPIAEEIIALSDVTGDHESLLDGHLWRLADASDAGDMVNAFLYSSEYVRRADQLGSPWHRYMARGSECFHACTQGEIVRALELSEEVRRLGLRVGEDIAEGFYEVRRLFMALHLGGECASEPPECVPDDLRLFWALASAQSHHDAFARRTLSVLAAGDFDGFLLGAMRLPSLAAMASVAVTLGEAASIARLYELLAPYEGRHLSLQAWVYMGPVSYYLGILAVASGERARARAHFERALNDTALMPLFQAYAQYELGQLSAAEGDASGPQLLSSALQAADSFGLLPLKARITAALGCGGNRELMHN